MRDGERQSPRGKDCPPTLPTGETPPPPDERAGVLVADTVSSGRARNASPVSSSPDLARAATVASSPDLASAATVASTPGIASAATVASTPRDSGAISSDETVAGPIGAPGIGAHAVGEVLGDRYQLLEELGRGGEGVVFRALDLRAETVVALKLFQQGEGSADRLARFRRELSMARKVTHRGVVRIHDLVELPGSFALSMELVEGMSLDSRLEKSPPLSALELFDLAKDLSRALAAAHEAGVTHRDLKPANVLLRKSGRAVITDFGVSRLHGVTESPSGDLPIESDHVKLTQDGRLIGTPQYMAPEQLAGSVDVGPPADVYAFGLVLFEAATGNRLHQATTLYELRELRRTSPAPSLETLRPDLLPRLSSAIDRCLQSDPAARFPSGAELAAHLTEPGIESRREAVSAESSPSSVALPPARTPWLPIALAVGCAAIAALIAVARPRGGMPSAPAAASAASASAAWPSTFVLTNPREIPAEGTCNEFPSFTPDSQRIVYDSTRGPDSGVVVQTLATGESRMITRTRGSDYAPSVSPDGRSVAFLRSTGGKAGTYLVDIDGAQPPVLVADGGIRPRFSRDGETIFCGDRAAPGRYRTADRKLAKSIAMPAGLLASHLLELPDRRLLAIFPQTRDAAISGVGMYDVDDTMTWLHRGKLGRLLELTPDGNYVLVMQGDDPAYHLVALPLRAGGEPIAMSATEMATHNGLAFAPDRSSVVWSTCYGHRSAAVVGRAGELIALPRGPEALEATGVPPGEKLLLRERSPEAPGGLWRIVDRSGGAEEIALPPAVAAPWMSADGSMITGMLGNQGIFVAPLADPSATRWLTHTPTDGAPSFRSDGQEIIFGRDLPEGDSQILSVPVAGGPTRVLVPTEATMPVASPVDDRVVFLSGRAVSACLPMVLDRKTGKTKPLSKKLPRGTYIHPAISPDGRRAAVVRGGTRVLEVDLATGALLRDSEVSGSTIFRVMYSGDDIVTLRTEWAGGLWIADGPFGTP